MVGKTISHFRVLDKIGSGGMGEVYLAEDMRLNRLAALKILPLESEADQDSVARFLREAKCAAALNHPNIAQIYEFDRSGEIHFIAMEYVNGKTLAQIMEVRTLPINEIVDIGVQIADALDTAHGAGVVHRDIKPENVMVTPRGIKVLDFGLAKRLDTPLAESDPTQVTLPGRVFGTLPYMSPEQALGHSVDGRSDLFSFGSLIYRITTGRVPFRANSLIETIDRICHAVHDPMGASRQGVPEGLERIVNKCLEKKRERRYQSARDLLVDLVPLKHGQTARHAPPDHRGANLSLMSPFIGREEEIEQIGARLRTVQLLTLTGTGGIGKTRLALEVASRHRYEFEDGFRLVDLAPVRQRELVVQSIAANLDVSEEPGKTLADTLKENLKARNVLVILDNCEHLLQTCAAIVEELLRDCPGLKVLVTSREPLGISAETIWRVSGLALPPNEDVTDEARIHRYEAIQLFEQRAVSSQPQFKLNAANAGAVVSICRRLDGIPLAIELAAARTRILTPQQIDERLKDRFRLLTTSKRDGLPRHRTLLAAMDWSHELLSEKERLVFARLSVFAGGWNLEAAESVCSGQNIETGEIVELLSELVEKSLVLAEAMREGMRFRFLETVREYAKDRFSHIEHNDPVMERLTRHFLRVAENADKEIRAGIRKTSVDLLDLDNDNVRTALAWIETRAGMSPIGLRMVAALAQFWQIRGHFTEGTRWTRTILDLPSEVSSTLDLARALNGAGNLAWLQGDHASANALHQESFQIRERAGDRPAVAESLQNLGSVAWSQGNLEAAQLFFERSLEIRKPIGDRRGIAICLNNLGMVCYSRNDLPQARLFLEQSLAIFRDLKDERFTASTLTNLGLLALAEGDAELARRFHEESLALRTELGDKGGICASLANLGFVACQQQDAKRARLLFQECLTLVRKLNFKPLVACSFEGLGHTAVLAGQFDRSARLYGAAEALRERINAPLPAVDRREHEAYLERVRSSLEHETFQARWAEGRAMNIEQAIAFALETPSEEPTID